MTNIDSLAPRPMSPPRLPSATIYRDTPLHLPRHAAARPFRSSVRALVQSDERASDGILIGLAALMLPTVVYSLWQASSLVSGGSLEHAIRAFLP